MRLNSFALAGAIFLVGVVVAVTAALVHVTRVLQTASSNIHQAAESIFVAEELRVEIDKLDTQKLDEDERAEIHDQVGQLVKMAEVHVTSEPEREILNRLKSELLLISGADQQQGSRDVPAARRLAMSLVSINREQAQQLQEEINKHYRLSLLIGGAAGLLMMVVSLALVLGVRSYLLRPLASILESIQQFAAGKEIRSMPKVVVRELEYIHESLVSMAKTIRENEQKQLEFVAGVAHDIRNPLNSLSLAIRLLAKDALPDRPDVARICTQQFQYLHILLEDLIDRSRVRAGTLRLKLERHNINEIVYEVFELYRESNPGHRFTLHAPPKPLYVNCDRHRLMQVLHNLTTNAVKYSPDGGEISLSIQPSAARVIISVSDTGLGIQPNELRQIFEPFRRGSQTSNIHGVGLGLAVSKYIVEQHQGAITVKSEVGKGSEFMVDLPLHDPTLSSPEAPAAPEPLISSRR